MEDLMIRRMLLATASALVFLAAQPAGAADCSTAGISRTERAAEEKNLSARDRENVQKQLPSARQPRQSNNRTQGRTILGQLEERYALAATPQQDETVATLQEGTADTRIVVEQD